MRKKIFLIVLFVATIFSTSFAENTRIFLDSLSYDSHFSEGDAEMVSNILVQTISDEGRFIVVSEVLDGDYRIQVTLNNKSCNPYTADNGKKRYKASLNYSVELVEVMTGKTVKTKVFSPGAGDFGSETIAGANTRQEAFGNLKSLIKNNMVRFINEALPLYGNVIEVLMSDKKRKPRPKGVEIAIGSDHGVKGSRRVQIVEKRSDGSDRILATFGIEEVQDTYSVCTSLASKKEMESVLHAMNSGGELKAKVIIPAVNTSAVLKGILNVAVSKALEAD